MSRVSHAVLRHEVKDVAQDVTDREHGALRNGCIGIVATLYGVRTPGHRSATVLAVEDLFTTQHEKRTREFNQSTQHLH